jgi:hypothetical protein
MELYTAFRQGRAEKDPAEFWYKGEIGFFDFYIIPLAKKLKDCGVFGVSSDEYLNYALKNREEWERKGEAVTAEMVAKARDKESARMERQASMRGPIIAEMKAAVETMRTPQEDRSRMFKQPSFRHLRKEPAVSESSVLGQQRGFRRKPPSNRASIGSSERSTLKSFRRNRTPETSKPVRDQVPPAVLSGLKLPDKANQEPSTVGEQVSPSASSGAKPPMEMKGGLRVPERRGSLT